MLRRPTAKTPDPPVAPRYVDPLAQHADATAAHPVAPAPASPSVRGAGRLLLTALAVNAWLAIKGVLRAARAEPAGMAAALAIGLVAGVVVARWRLADAPGPTPVYAAPANAALAATATAAAPGSAWTAPTAAPEPSTGGLPVWLPATVTRWADNITRASERYGVPPALQAIVVTVESCGYERAVSPAGALGLGQVVPKWHPRILEGDPNDPDHNLDVSAEFLGKLWTLYGGDVDKVAASYNGGSPANASAETTRYRQWVGGMWAERTAATSATYARWRAAVDATPGNMCGKAAGA